MFTSHLLSSPENQEIIGNTDRVVKMKEELAKAKSEATKGFYRKKKKKRKQWVERKR